MNRISVKCIIFWLLLNAIVCHCKKYDKEWQKYKKRFNKQYDKKEEEIRRITWEKTHRRILKHNKKYEKGETLFAVGHNRMSDWKNEERAPPCASRKDPIVGKEYDYENYTAKCDKKCQSKLPKNVDWREKYVITPVKEQGGCMSCYAFGTIAAVEAAYAKATGDLVSFSEQEIVDCSGEQGNSACSGGGVENTLEYMFDTWGISREKVYPYEAKEGKCRRNPKWKRYDIDAYHNLLKSDEDNLKAVIALDGPVAASITANPVYFNSYKHGFISHEACDAPRPNHAVAVIGYGVENNTGYWLIKNSYGVDWGLHGYGWILRDGHNWCYLATDTYLPTVTTKPFL